jgi:ABC-type Fe3+/spermidine/putrescine transport system ATPase subunit
VTHDQDEALAMATRIGLLHNGRLAQVGTPSEVYERPANRYVAEFMGGANILPGTVREAGPDAVLDVPAVGVVRASGQAPAGPGTVVHLAVRAERLRLDDTGAADGRNRVSGTVADVAYRGDVVEVAVRLADGSTLSVLRPLGQGAGAGLPERGATATVAWAPEACVMLAE